MSDCIPLGFSGCLVGFEVFLHSSRLVERVGISYESSVWLVGRVSSQSMIVVLS
jgi:hypothetical protein